MQTRFARLTRGAFMLLAATYWVASCSVPDFEFEGTQVAPGPDASAGEGGQAGVPGVEVPGVFDCASDLDCQPYTALPNCNVVTRQCVECTADNDTCPTGFFCAETSSCTPGCTNDQDCMGAGPNAPGNTGGSAGGGGKGGNGGSSGGGGTDNQGGEGGAAGEASGQGGEVGMSGQGGEGGATGSGGSQNGGSAGGPSGGVRCDTNRNVCTGCRDDSDCPLGTLCNAANTQCVPGCTEDRGCPDGLSCCSGECSNLQTSEEHCGGCDAACDLTGTVAICADGSCMYGGCREGFVDCNGDPGDGCEVDTTTDPENCGGCNQPCSAFPNSAAACVDGMCSIGRCNTGYANCGGPASDGCETNILTSSAHCGGCDIPCALEGANATCQASVCRITSCKPGFENCDGVSSNGCETDIYNDLNNCGDCMQLCELPNAMAECVLGNCQASECLAPNADCNGQALDGCEVNTNTDPQNCGACETICNLPNAVESCSNGLCAVADCNEGYGDCDGNPSNGCEVNLNTSAQHCGECNDACVSNNGTPSCALGACSISCNAGFENCDGEVGNGCEVNTQLRVDHCGACGNACSTQGGTPACNNGVCGISMCTAPLDNCDGNQGNGCETNTAGDVNHCGGCGADCFVANGTPGCTMGDCNLVSCSVGYDDCNGFYEDGCEANLRSLVNCGECDQPCLLPNAVATCQTGTCLIQSCTAPWADCDNNPANGCETNTETSVGNCGACGAVCNNNHGSPFCSGSQCGIVCSAGWGNCNALANDGCETSLTNNVSDCGACGATCSVLNGQPTCNGTTCGVLSCTAPWANCDGQYATGCEVNTSNTVGHCGACGAACNATQGVPACSGSMCTIGCNPGAGNCDGNSSNGCETDLTSSVFHCGACGNDCVFANGNPTCTAGSCQLLSCNDGFGNCDGNAANGCEVNLRTTVGHCGGCGQACNLPNANETCSSGTCAIASCTSPFADCDGVAANGCETNLNTSILHCSGCGEACNDQNGTATCTTGVCGITCAAGFRNCDGDLANGCEIQSSSDVTNCGMCGNICSPLGGTPNCVNGVCGISSCAPGLGDCDGSPGNGCEVDLTSTENHCGACGALCQTPNGTAECINSTCTLVGCNEGRADCNGVFADGCEVNIRTTTDCGTCGVPCDLVNATESCATGACQVVSCTTPFGNCDGVNGNGCETNTNTSLNNCGTCGNICSTANGTPTCSTGTCTISCAAGFGNCDSNAANGCETTLTNNVNACGSCTNPCAVANGTAGCVGTQCTVASCAAPNRDCNGLYADGCETNSNTNLANCGTCGTVCNGSNGTASCALGACSIMCNAGFGNCDGNAQSNGCEANLNTSLLHCGGCGAPCSHTNASSICNNGTCQLGACNAGWANCDGNAANGCETNITTVSNCGACGIVCDNTGHGTTACTAGVCNPTCSTTFANCDGNPNNGCETSIRTTTDCNGCGVSCDFSNAAESCSTGVCTLGTCNTGFGNCDGNNANGCETNTNSTVAHCGACGAACSSTNGTPGCGGGVCTITCNSGFGDCTAAAGCETNTSTSVSHCGTCGNACSFNNAAATCFGGTCQLGACNANFANCDGNPANGCETDLRTLSNCGACGSVCNLANAAESCASGTCTLGTCSTNFDNCDGIASNGCETSLLTLSDCGSCDTDCDRANASESCSTGTCTLGTCNSGFGNCDMIASNGCETAVNTTSNCGACGTQCTNAHGTTSCVSGACSPSCAAGWLSCDGNPNNGCERDINTLTDCGACGATCARDNASESCVAGVCTLGTCEAGWGNCDGIASNGCETPLNTVTNCGACGTSCTNANGMTSCTAGVCTPTCNTGFGNCDGNANNGCETNRNTNVNHCGTCGNVCMATGGTPNCVNGMCGVSSCMSGLGDCDGNSGNGCETALTSLTNCGGCGTTCNLNNASESCSTGTCTLGTCTTGFANCNMMGPDGCEINTQTSTGNCGACGTICSAANGTASCAMSACQITCNSGFGNCDGNAQLNGCEAPLTSVTNCGACGVGCTNPNGTTACTAGACVPSCAAGFASCDSNANNGCETDISPNGPAASLSNCGTCGTNNCTRANASVTCGTGTCTLGTCNSGFGNCDANAGNGCETALNTTSNCGACGSICGATNAAPVCTAGACVMNCSANFGNCDGTTSNGCEAPLQTSTSNCGTCGNVCGSANGTASCSLGACSITCNAGFGNCDGINSNGCETALNTTSNCGACGNTCTNANGSTACTGGVCVPSCTAGFGSCNGDPDDGCETDISPNGPAASLSNCGTCGTNNCTRANASVTCGTGTCTLGTCNANFGNCDGNATNGCEQSLVANVTHCGTCGNGCTNANGTTSCPSGTCVPVCNSGFGNCNGDPDDGCETNTQTTTAHCGGCGMGCSFANAGASCAAGGCVLGTCNSGFGNCDGTASNGCEAPLNTTANCGSCGNGCTNAHGTTACTAGACAPSCTAGWGNCNSNNNDGCETATNPAGPAASLSNCGTCGTNNCTRTNASVTCSTGSCAISTCNAGWGNCDGNATNGCETNTQTSVTNCGGCGSGFTCSSANGTPTCSLSACQISCNAGWGNCDGNAQSNGCETNTNTNNSHCGACGNVCGAGSTCTAGVCVGSVNLKAQYKLGEGANTANNEAVKPHFRLYNLGTSAVALSSVKIRYWYTRDTIQPQTGNCDFSTVTGGCGNVTRNFVAISPARFGGEYVFEVGFTAAAGDLAAGANVEMQTWFNKNNWSMYSEQDDYSFDPTKTAFADWNRVTVYFNDVLVWGVEPTVCVACDQFENGIAGWTPTGGTWTNPTDGSLVYRGGLASALSTIGTASPSQTVQSRMKIMSFGGGTGNGYRAGITARYNGSTNYYAFMLDQAGDLQLRRGASTVSGTGTCATLDLSLTTNTWYWLKMQVSGPTNNARIITWYAPYGAGALSFTQVHDCTLASSTVDTGTAGVLTFQSGGTGVDAEFEDFMFSSP